MAPASNSRAKLTHKAASATSSSCCFCTRAWMVFSSFGVDPSPCPAAADFPGGDEMGVVVTDVLIHPIKARCNGGESNISLTREAISNDPKAGAIFPTPDTIFNIRTRSFNSANGLLRIEEIIPNGETRQDKTREDKTKRRRRVRGMNE